MTVLVFSMSKTTLVEVVIPGLRVFFQGGSRHTRLQGDWSSDVCSSDLALRQVVEIRRRLIRQAHEYQARECPHVHRLQAPLRRRGLAGGAATDDPALEVVGPAVVRALQGRAGNAAVLLQDARTAMPAGVMEGADRAVIPSADEERPGPDLESAVVAALGNFRLAGHEQPVTAEDAFELGCIQPLV